VRLLFITWDGPQVSYLEGLFLPIFHGLRTHGIGTDVLQFRWGGPAKTQAIARLCETSGVGYQPVQVMRKLGGVGAVASALSGARHIRRAMRDFGSDVLMPRSLMPALATLAAGGRRLAPMVFDALAADERIEFAGSRPNGLEYRALRHVEAAGVQAASSVIVRTTIAAAILAERASVPHERFHVVANGRDQSVFRPATAGERQQSRAKLGITDQAPVLVYAGSVGPQYRFDRIAATAHALHQRRPDSRLLVLSGDADAAKAELTRAEPRIAEMLVVRRVAPDQVPRLLGAADAGLAFRATSFSTQALAPIKIGEYLLCGLPVIGTAAVGDTSAAVEAGVFLDERHGPAFEADWLVDEILPNCGKWRTAAREIGVARFSLARSIADYRDALAPVAG
jgi:glycosyltransferase involved in cell wall biosynthesis